MKYDLDLYTLLIQGIGALFSLLALLVSIVALVYLKRYTIHAQRQVEGTVLPVVVIKVDVENTVTVCAKNIGCGPALNCYWRVRNKPDLHGKFPYLGKDEKVALHWTEPKPTVLTIAALNEGDVVDLVFDSAMGTGYCRWFQFIPKAGADGRPMFYRHEGRKGSIDRL